MAAVAASAAASATGKLYSSTNATTRSLSLIYPIPNYKKLSFSSSALILRSLSLPFFSHFPHRQYSLSSFPLPLPLPLLSSSPSNAAVFDDGAEEEFEEDLDDGQEYGDGNYDEDEDKGDESDGRNNAFDVDALEREAKDAVREFSSSLSRQLTIGAGLQKFSFF